MQTIAICVGRELGSGGSEIAKAIAKELGFRYCDSEVINAASVNSGLDKRVFEKSDEERSTFTSYLSGLIPFLGGGDFYGNSFDEETLFHFLSQTISDFAQLDSCVFVGRCAEYVLREKKEMLSVFVCADPADRIQRIIQRKQCSAEQAKKIITQGDRKRANFHDFYSNHQWGRASTYDLCLNTSRLGIDGSLQIVLDYIYARFPQLKKNEKDTAAI